MSVRGISFKIRKQIIECPKALDKPIEWLLVLQFLKKAKKNTLLRNNQNPIRRNISALRGRRFLTNEGISTLLRFFLDPCQNCPYINITPQLFWYT